MNCVEVFGIAGINRNGCTIAHMGVFAGYLQPDPDNKYDSNAIKVMHKNGTLLGYIKAKDTARVREMLGEALNGHTFWGHIKYVVEHTDDCQYTGGQPGNDGIRGFFVGYICLTNNKI